MTHDPSEYIRGLQQLLVSDKKKIAFLFGAGTSLAKKNSSSKNIPAIDKMTRDIETTLSLNDKYKHAIEEIKQELGEENYNIEKLLSNIEQKKLIIGEGKLNNLNCADLILLRDEIKKNIRNIVSIHKEINKDLEDVLHVDFADWVGKADRKYPIEIFTTNYDYLFELALEYNNLPYYDGFTGSYQPFFNSDSIEDLSFLPRQTKLWKMHGSLGWHFDKESKKIWRKDSDSEDILIYPSLLKYDESRKQPYMALGDRLTNFLKLPDTILITCGYSFGDEHINERILTALRSNSSAHVYVLFYDLKFDENGKKDGYSFTEDCALSKMAIGNSKMSVFAFRNAVIGCQYGQWQLKREPDKDDTIKVNTYFDEDGYTNISDPLSVEKKGEEFWTGTGELIIPDFKFFISFLQSMIFNQNQLTD
jgi:hypothetical protein